MNGNTSLQDFLDNGNVAQAILQYQNTLILSIGPITSTTDDSMPSQPILYKSHSEWIATAQCHKGILYHYNTKMIKKV